MKHLFNNLLLLTFVLSPGCTCATKPTPATVPPVATQLPADPDHDSPSEQRVVKDVQTALDVFDGFTREYAGTPVQEQKRLQNARESLERYKEQLLKARECYPHNTDLAALPHSESDFEYYGGAETFTGSGELIAAWKLRLKPLPKDARNALEKGLRCLEKIGGDELSGDDLKKWKQLKCHSIDEELEKLRSKYSSNLDVINAINCVDETAAAHDCPVSTMRDR